MIDARDKEEFERTAYNFRGQISTLATRLMDEGAHDAAGKALVLERLIYGHANALSLALSAVLPAVAPEPDPERRKRASAGKRAPKGQGAHRHEFGDDGACACGAKRQRAPKGSAEARTVPLPLAVAPRAPLGDDAPDRFDGGTFGSSGVERRR
jgi:hypothetical protein